MTEEIIIDGVNVAGCDFVSKIGGCDSYTDGVCEGHNCEHKQLKRLEQERDELKKQNAILLGQLVINDGEDVTVQISQSQFDEYNELKQENELFRQAHKAEQDRRRKYENALEEIREYSINFCKKTCRFYANEDSMACNEYCLLDDIVNPILDKINEVLGNESN